MQEVSQLLVNTIPLMCCAKLHPHYYDVHPDQHPLYQSDYDPNPLDNFYGPPQPTFTRQPVSLGSL